MKHLGIITILVLMSVNIFGQSKLDSLQSELHFTKQDTKKLNLLLEISKELRYINIDSSLYYSMLGYKLAEELERPLDMAIAIDFQAWCYIVKGEYKEPLGLLQKGLDLIQHQIKKRKYDDINVLKSEKAKLYNTFSNLYSAQFQYSIALEYLYKSLRVLEELDDRAGMIPVYGNLGLIYGHMADEEKSYEFTFKAYELCVELDKKHTVAHTLLSLGVIHSKKGELAEAMDYYQKSLEISKQIGNKRIMANSLSNIGNMYSAQNDLSKAREYYYKALKILEEISYKQNEAHVLASLGRNYFDVNQYHLAEFYLNRAIKLSEETSYFIAGAIANGILSDLLANTGRYREALEAYKKSVELRDSIAREENQRALIRTEIQYDFEKRALLDSLSREEERRTIELAHQEEIRKRNLSRNLAIGSGLFVFMLAGGLWNRLQYTNKTKKIIEAERDRSENLLLNILPAEIAQELKTKGAADAKDYDEVTILFTDFKEFTQASEQMDATELVSEINECFKAFDGICEKYRIEKIKTIGDAYMAAGGLPVPDEQAVVNTVNAGLEMAAFMVERKKIREAAGKIPFEMRTGIHTGPVVAGIVGVKKFQYDIWGDTVNTAARMESSGEVDCVNISHSTYKLINDRPEFQFESRGKIEVKGKGELEMYFVKLKEFL